MRGSSLGLLALAAGLLGCIDERQYPDQVPAERTVGDFVVRFREGGFLVAAANDPSRVLIETPARGTVAPVALRAAEATWQMQYGQFLVTDGDDPWVEAPRLREGGRLLWLDAEGLAAATMELEAPAERTLVITLRSTRETTNRLALSLACRRDDRFLGFGAQADALDHRGHKIPIWTSEPGIGKSATDDPPELWMIVGARHASSMGLPTWLSRRGYIGLLESDARSVLDVCAARDDVFRLETWAPVLRLWLHDGPAPAAALERATAGLLGRPPAPPPLAFAPWHDAIHGSAEVRRVARLLRDEKIPSSALWTEDFRGGEETPVGYRLKEEWDVDPELYPDARALGEELRADGFAWLAYFNTFLVRGTRVFDEARAGDHFVLGKDRQPYLFDGVTFQPTGLADLSRPATREWVKGYLRRALDLGFDGWMADYGEWLPADARLASGEDPLLAHNRYAAEWVALNDEVLGERDDGRQRLFFARAGWIGSAARAPVFWGGDQRTDFQPDDGLPTVVPLALGLGLAGVSTFGHDIAGYQSATNGPSTKELYFRWTELGALSPVMRTHHGVDPSRNWWFGKDRETLDHFRRWATLHVRLFPYLDGGAAIAESTGMPLMRALPLEFPDDDAGWGEATEYLLGPSLLVAPVTVEGARSRAVHLPPDRWFPLAGGAAIEGPLDLEVDAALEDMPIFLRAGAIVPLLPEGVQTLLPAAAPTVDLEDVDAAREILVVVGDGAFVERDGTRYHLSAGRRTGHGFHEAGKPLPACTEEGERGCTEIGPWGTTRVRLGGQGPLALDGHVFTIDGPGARRRIDVLVRR